MPRFGDMAMSCVRGSFGSLHRIDDPDSCLCSVDPKATSERRQGLIAQNLKVRKRADCWNARGSKKALGAKAVWQQTLRHR